VERSRTSAGISTFGIFSALLARTAALMRCQPRHRNQAIALSPHNQRPKSAAPGQSRTCAVGNVGTAGGASVNGWLICTIVDETDDVAVLFTGKRLPRPISNANGMKNLSDALNQSP
jgi:hypothetical protein